METHVVKGTQEILTQDLPQAEELLIQEGPQDAEVLTDEPADKDDIQSPDKKPHTRNRRARAFTMSDEVHALLGTLAQRNSTNMSTYIETLILTADDLSLTPQAQELLGVMATKTGKTRGQVLEMLVHQAETVLSWDPQVNVLIGTLAARNGITRAAFLEMLVLNAEGIMSWEPPQLKPKPWWKFWQPPQSEQSPAPMFRSIVEAGSTPKLSGIDRS